MKRVTKKNLVRHIVGALLLWLIGVVTLIAQENNSFRHFSKKDGLSQGSVFAITQDADGYMWFGTRDGLNKYDGYDFTVYRHAGGDPGSLSGNDVRVLYYDSLYANMWVGTFDGLSKYDSSVDTFQNFTIQDGLTSNTVRSILRDSKGRLWVGVANGLNLYDQATESFKPVKLPFPFGESASVYTLFERQNGEILLGLSSGVYSLNEDDAGRVVVKPILNHEIENVGAPDYFVQAIAEDQSGNLWIGTKMRGVYRLDNQNNTWKVFQNENADGVSISSNDVRALAIGPENDIWIGTFTGLNKYELAREQFQYFKKEDLNSASLSNSSIKSLFFDQRGGLWIGTYHGGVNYYDPDLSRFKNYEENAHPQSLSHNVVSSFAEDDNGNFWIGTEGGGLNYLDRSNAVFANYKSHPGQKNGISGNNVKTLLRDGNKMWIGTFSEGLNCLDLNTQQFRHYKADGQPHSLSNNNVYSLLKEKNRLWILTYGGGLNMLDLETDQFRVYQSDDSSESINSNYGRVILKDSRHRLWFGTEYGLDLGIRNSLNDLDLRFQNVLENTKIYALFEDRSGTIWIGTFSNGLFSMDPGTFELVQYTEEDGLPGHSIFGILQDNAGHLWLSTNNGISKLDVRQKAFTNFNYSDGLKNLEFNFNAHYKSSSGEILFGGINGFTIFQPADILPNNFIPPPVFTELKVHNKVVNPLDDSNLLSTSVNLAETLTFKYNTANFSIGIAALEFFNPSTVQYAYKLEGLDNEWKYTVGQTEANYTIQRPGTYTFRARAANSDGVWNQEERQLKIVVKPPPWLSVWAYAIYALLLAVAVYSGWFFVRLRNRLHLERLAKAQQEELNEMKLRFFTDITHEFRTPLTLIMGPLDELMRKQASNEKLVQLQSVRRNAQRLLNLVNQVLSFRKLESDHEPVRASQGNIVGYVHQIYLFFEEAALKRGITYAFQSEADTYTLWFDHEKLEKVFFNLLSNAFKFTPDGGDISVLIRRQEDRILISVSDNGNGIKKELHEQIFKRYFEKVALTASNAKGSGIGLALSKQMVELHHGRLWVESEIGEGASFFVELPTGNSHFSHDEIRDDAVDMTPNKLVKVAQPMMKSPDFSWLEDSVGTVDLPPDAPHILVVEDNIEIQQYVHSIFQQQYKVTTSINGMDGLEKAKKINPALIISDIMMPEMDGVTMCERLKSDISTSHIPIILLTARSAQFFKNEGLETGADDYLTKPFNPEELRLRVRNIIRSRKNMHEKFVRIRNIEPKEITVTSADEDFLNRLLEVAEKQIDNANFTAAQFAYELAVSRPLLFTKIKALTNQTPNNFMKTMRMKRAAQLLDTRKLNVSEVAYKVGFKDTRYFSKCFQKQYHMTPSEYMSEAEN